MKPLLIHLMAETAAQQALADEPESPGGSQNEFTSAFENAAIGMALVAPDSRRLRVNKAFCRMLGYSAAELLLQAAQHITHPDDVAEDRRQRARCLAGEKETYQREKRYVHRNGHVVWGHLTCTLVRDASGRPLHFISQVQDITVRKETEQALRQSEARFRSLTMLSSDWYWEQDEHFRFTVFSGGEKAGPWRGRQQDAIGKRRWDLAGHVPVCSTWDHHRARLEAHEPFHDFEVMRVVEGEPTRYLSSSGEPIFDGAGRFVGYRGTARDITGSRLAEQRLRDTQALLHMAAQIGRLGAWAFDVGEPRVLWSAEVCAIHEVKPGFRPTPAEVAGFFAPQYRDAMQGVLRNCLRDGSPFDVEAQIITARGRALWVRVIGEAEWDAQGRVRRLQGACQDISESKRAAEEAHVERVEAQREILRLNAELEERVRQRTAQLEAANKELEAFSYSIAHDLRAPLSSIDGFSQMLEQSVGKTLAQRSRHYLNRIRAGVQQMGELTDGLLALANLSRASLRSEPVDLAVLARAAAASCREGNPGRRADIEIAPTLPVRGDSRLLSQVIGNLFGNAWKFTARREVARIEVGTLPGPDGCRIYFVRDNGAGFDMAYASRMFEAFQRMHSSAEFEGTGIGLAIVHKIVARHGGRIWAESAPDCGASVYFTLGPAPD